ncbi:MAG: peptidoglycan editing factor PgeF [Eubacteriales bacterium]|nr:peptidoglycan editing factor PgeF [Eubacteriales bacterium]
MQIKKFEMHAIDGALLKTYESKLPLINGYTKENRSTYFEYHQVDHAVVPILKYHIYDGYQECIHGFSTRQGGVSKEHLSSMNLSSSRGDDLSNVMENYRRYGIAAQFDPSKLVCSDQVHETTIYVATEKDAGRGTTDKEKLVAVDGLVTNVYDLPLMTFYADCVPIYFFDPIKKVVGLAHSGWRGTVKNIAEVMIRTMQETYGCMPDNIICAIGPSICESCYEVGVDVAEAFQNAYSPEQYKKLINQKSDEKYQLDLHKACYYNLVNAGVLESHIALPDLCTCCNPSVFYSHRASKGLRGNLGAVIMLRK